MSSELTNKSPFATFGMLIAFTSTIERSMMVVHQFQGIFSKGNRMSRFIFSTLAVVGLLTLGSGAVFAQHGHSHGGGHGGGHYSGGHGGFGVGHAVGHTLGHAVSYGGGYGHASGHYDGGYYSGGHVYAAPSYSYAPQHASVASSSCGSSYQSYAPAYQSYTPVYQTTHYDHYAPAVYSHGHHSSGYHH